MTLTAAAAAGGGPEAVTLITGGLLAAAAVVSSLTPVVLARRRARKENVADITAAASNRADLTLAGWTALNAALQTEITRLQGVTERLQARIDLLENEIAALTKQAMGGRGPPDA